MRGADHPSRGVRACASRSRSSAVLRVVVALGVVGAAPVPAAASDRTEIVINGRVLDAARRVQIESATGVPLLPGRWWYDARSGLWGRDAQGPAGFARPGLDVGAPLPAQASAGRTGVYMNGRQLVDAEVRWLQTLGPVWPGRYWLDAYGNVGLEGRDWAFANLVVLAAQQRHGGGSGTSQTTSSGTWIAGQGGCVIVSGRSSSGIGSFGASTC